MRPSLTGKPGHTGKVFRNPVPVMASELVNQRPGEYNDEDVAELLQALHDRSRNLDGGPIGKTETA